MKSKHIQVLGSSLHYLESGEGDPILFLHGIPTSSYLWIKVIPNIAPYARCIAVDLIGMGESSQPDITYTIQDHLNYLSAFIDALDLHNITLVCHGWGSVIGLSYASKHQERFSALAFYESHLRPTVDWAMLSLPMKELMVSLDEATDAYEAVMNTNAFIEQYYALGAVKPLSDDVQSHFVHALTSPKARRPIWQYLVELPSGQGAESTLSIIEAYSSWLKQTTLPKLMLYAVPGFMTTMDTLQWAKQKLSHLSLEGMDDVLHFAPETNDQLFAGILLKWYLTLPGLYRARDQNQNQHQEHEEE